MGAKKRTAVERAGAWMSITPEWLEEAISGRLKYIEVERYAQLVGAFGGDPEFKAMLPKLRRSIFGEGPKAVEAERDALAEAWVIAHATIHQR